MKKRIFTLAIALMAFGFLKAQTPVEAVVAKDTSALSAYAGKYKMTENEYVKEVMVFVKDGKLMSYSPEKEEIELVAKEADTFEIDSLNAKVVFSRENGAVKGVKILVQGIELKGEKL